LQDEKTPEEKNETDAKIAGLRATLAEHTETRNMLVTQLRRLEVGAWARVARQSATFSQFFFFLSSVFFH
jgi:hypothetical protein